MRSLSRLSLRRYLGSCQMYFRSCSFYQAKAQSYRLIQTLAGSKIKWFSCEGDASYEALNDKSLSHLIPHKENTWHLWEITLILKIYRGDKNCTFGLQRKSHGKVQQVETKCKLGRKCLCVCVIFEHWFPILMISGFTGVGRWLMQHCYYCYSLKIKWNVWKWSLLKKF